MLLYPGNARGNNFQPYLTDDYSLGHNQIHSRMDHQCKMGFVSVLEGVELDQNMGVKILKQIGLKLIL